MTTTPDNPPAFPTHHVEKEPGQEPFMMSIGGMTLRDYFAAKAMAQLIAHKERLMSTNAARYSGVDCEECVAKAAYMQADAMLTERNRRAES